jgi:hypothetical protein
VLMDIQVIHCKKKIPSRLVGCKPVAQFQHLIVKMPQVSPPLSIAPVERKGLSDSLITQDCHQKTHGACTLLVLTPCITASLSGNFSKLLVLCLKIEVALINVNNIPSAFPHYPARECCIPVLPLLVQIYWKVCTVEGGGCFLSKKSQPQFSSANLRSRVRWIVGVPVVHVGTNFINVGLRLNCPIQSKIKEVLTMNLAL